MLVGRCLGFELPLTSLRAPDPRSARLLWVKAATNTAHKNRAKISSNREQNLRMDKFDYPGWSAVALGRWGALIDSRVGDITAWEIDRARPSGGTAGRLSRNRANWVPRIDSAYVWSCG